jgi:hypothetical protein
MSPLVWFRTGLRTVGVVFLVRLSTCLLLAQEQTPPPPPPAEPETQEAPAGTSNDRLFFALPNFLTVENGQNLPPLTTKQKYDVVVRTAFDASEFPWYGIIAGIRQAQNSDPSYGGGATGYAKRYGLTFVDGTIENFMVSAVSASAFHLDPRYYQLGTGGAWHRTAYSVSRLVVTRNDAGQTRFNYAEILGSAAAAGLSAAYHPAADRTVRATLVAWESQVGYDALAIVLKEFWPDIRRKIGSASATKSSLTESQSPTDVQPTHLTNQGQPAAIPSNDRLLWALPNFLTVENAADAAPLATGEKFHETIRSSFDYVDYGWYAFVAGLSQRDGSDPGYGSGAGGYVKRYGSAFADGTIENVMTSAVFPSLLGQDPRYYQLGKCGARHRTGYSVSRTFITRSDAGRRQFNFSEILGSAVAAGVSTTYLASRDRSVAGTLSTWELLVVYDTAQTVLKEFWPDIRRKVSHH